MLILTFCMLTIVATNSFLGRVGRRYTPQFTRSCSSTPLGRSRAFTKPVLGASQLDGVSMANYGTVSPNHGIEHLNSEKSDKMKVIFVLGGPGAGKGTQCDMISREFGIAHLSAGELLRNERASGSENGQLIEELISDGKIVPATITLGLLRTAMEKASCSRFLIDGFPRNWDNVDCWNENMADSCEVESVWFIDCDEAELERRLLSRGRTSGRSDDNLEAARKRFTTYKESTLPIIEHFRALSKVISVRGDQPVHRVNAEIRDSLLVNLEHEVLARNEALLTALATNDWPRYKTMCHPSMTVFESRSDGALIEGFEGHELGFTHGPEGSSSGTLLTTPPHVRIMGQTAVVSYKREVTSPQGGDMSRTVAETRVYQMLAGNWLQVHYHSTVVS